jgi:16S rRNA U516 pseudouridylate synthase RsuA-like enzyme
VGCPPFRLVRDQVGPVELGDLPVGTCRALTQGELAGLTKGPGPSGLL